jgi:hypothetical protein
MDGILTALHVLISILFFKCSKTFSRFPARAARKNDVLPSDCKEIKKIMKDIVSSLIEFTKNKKCFI